jgi:cysteinyl-tRNA synthetase
MANVWMHNGFLQVEGEKMSKSLGNFVTIHELLRTTKFGGRKWSGEALRLAMLRTHYRQPIDWTVKALEEAENLINGWMRLAVALQPTGATPIQMPQRPLYPPILEALRDDLNTPAAIAELHRLRNSIVHSTDQQGLTQFSDALRFFGFLRDEVTDALEMTEEQKRLFEQRLTARREKNWAEADRLRDRLAALGVAIKDTKDGATTWEPKR